MAADAENCPQSYGSTQSLVDTKKQSRPATKHGPHVMAFCVTNFGVVLVPYPPNSEESQSYKAHSHRRVAKGGNQVFYPESKCLLRLYS